MHDVCNVFYTNRHRSSSFPIIPSTHCRLTNFFLKHYPASLKSPGRQVNVLATAQRSLECTGEGDVVGIAVPGIYRAFILEVDNKILVLKDN